MKRKFPWKRWIIKSIIIFVLFLSFLFVSLFTKLPIYFDSYVYYENFEIKALLFLILYRVVMYFLFPVVISLFEYKKGKNKFIKILLENFNIEFFVYGLISFIYVFLGVDKILDADIFSSSDAFMLITGFIFCIILNGSIPAIVYSDD